MDTDTGNAHRLPNPRRAAQREATRQRVRDVAARLFVEQGLDGTQVRDIADAAGVSVGTVMTLGDKETLFLAALEEPLTRRALEVLRKDQGLQTTLQALARTMIHTTPRERAMAKDYLSVYLRRHGEATGPDSQDRLADVINALAETWRAHSDRPVSPDQARQRAREYYGACLGMAYGVAADVLAAGEALDILDHLARRAH